MTKLRTLTLAAALLAVALAAAPARAGQQQATQDSLVKAWEQVQKGDPETVTFEKVGERRYRFKTNRFPFDGELRILKATVNESPRGFADEELGGDYKDALATGVIEYDLVGLSEEVSRKYEHSFANWQATNALYFDEARGSWITSEEYRARLAAKYRETARTLEQREQHKKTTGFWLSMAMSWLPVFLLLGFLVWLFKRSGVKNQRQYMNMATLHMQRSDEHMRRSEELLERIAAAVEAADKARPQ
ncbi:MAG TPA: hypothetical protein VF588_18615 [Pyrinomonadaceae bacterium]|jgi:hypothetical protein